MKIYKYILALVFTTSFLGSYAQITIEPAEWLPCEQIKIIIDITQGECDKLVGTGPTESLYLWTWMPAGPAIEGGNGAWESSNELLKLTYEGPNLWSYTMVPTEFYGVEAAAVYTNGFSMLVKKKNGGSGPGCDPDKTSDYTLAVPAPFVSKKVYLFPEIVFQDDFMTFIYDENLETKASMQNLSEYYVYARAIDTDGGVYEISPASQVGDNPKLKLKDKGNGKYGITVIPKAFFSVPNGKTILNIEFTVRKKVVIDPLTDQVDEVAAPFELGCGPAQSGC